ncbi:hypothetical protein, partial [Escherichia coli]|uniref:hypothetical protein n=1 Tax=Escherichia coli TaxID=562 RepID=UPI003C6DA56A
YRLNFLDHPFVNFIIGITWRDDDGFWFLHIDSSQCCFPLTPGWRNFSLTTMRFVVDGMNGKTIGFIGQ